MFEHMTLWWCCFGECPSAIYVSVTEYSGKKEHGEEFTLAHNSRLQFVTVDVKAAGA